ncbi:site-specific DNA-methyltransferase, partial [bacterium]|nr:site-specific DNA-methyltransferase [bacterium]
MTMSRYHIANPEDLVSAAKSSEAVTGLTHNFYRYPARFSPLFAREVIRAFTDPGDVILDPF